MNRFRRKPGQKGFTMIELMVVVIIVAILAAIAIPLYGRYVKNSRTTEATGRIGEILTAAKAFAQENPNGSGQPMWPTNANLQNGDGVLDPTSTTNFTYALGAGAGTAATGPLTITATGQNQMNGVTVSVTVNSMNDTGNPPVITGM
jgi:prepilin-type N-terminal cleavage/methylation domain-containing protein